MSEWAFCQREYDLIREFIDKYCRLSKAPWTGKTPQILPWQDELFRAFAWQNEHGRKKHKVYHCWLPKKNCKSPTGAILGLQQLLRYRGNDIVIISATTKQAGMVFDEAAAMVSQSPELSKRLWCRPNLKVIQDRKGFGKIEVVACRPQISGFNCSCICDEVAEWPKCHAQLVLDKIGNAGDSKPFAFTLFLSTAQGDKSHPGYDLYRTAKEVKVWNEWLERKDEKRPGIDRPDVFSIIHEIGEHEDWRNLDLIRKANPAIEAGVLDFDDIKRDLKALETEPKGEPRFRLYRANQWGVSHDGAWIPGDLITKCEADFTEDDLLDSEKIFFGIDYARRFDLCCYSIVALRGDRVFVLPRFFIPTEVAARKEKLDGVPYSFWASDPANNLTLTAGDVVDPREMRLHLMADYEKFKPLEIAFDPWGLEESRQVLTEQGLPMTEIPQTPRHMTPGLIRFERLIVGPDNGPKMKFQKGNKLFAWNISNCKCRPLGGSDLVALSKRLSTGRIDGVTATVLGLGRLVASEQALSFGVF